MQFKFVNSLYRKLFLVGVLFAVGCSSTLPKRELPASEINKLSREITVAIEGGSSTGSGFIFSYKNGTYYVLTSEYAIQNSKEGFEVFAPDGKNYSADLLKRFSDLGIAVLTFRTERLYITAENIDHSRLQNGETLYVAGFNAEGEVITERRHQFSPGEYTSKSFSQGKEVLTYDNRTLEGMAGGPVFDARGYVVGVHIEEDSGMPISAFETAALEIGVRSESKIRNLNFDWEQEFPDIKSIKSSSISEDGGVYVATHNESEKSYLIAEIGKDKSLTWIDANSFKAPREALFKDTVRNRSNTTDKVVTDDFNNTYFIRAIAISKVPERGGAAVIERRDIEITKVDITGKQLWKKTIQGDFSSGLSATVDQNENIYIALKHVNSNSSLDKVDPEFFEYAEVFQIDKSGEMKLRRKTSYIEESNILDIVNTETSLVASVLIDLFLNTYWKAKIDTSKEYTVSGMKTVSRGNTYVWGQTRDSLAGFNSEIKSDIRSHGDEDIWILAYDSEDTLIWKRQLSDPFLPIQPVDVIIDDDSGNIFCLYSKESEDKDD